LSIARLCRKQTVAVGSLFLLAAALRFFGLWWGAPERVDLHPDEMEHVMRHALSISLADPDPHFLNYPSLLIYLIAILNGALTRLGWVTEPWQSYIVARAIVASFGAATAPAVFWLVSELTGSVLAAMLSGLWLALLPLHVWESHFAVTDVVMTFWIVVVLALSVRLLHRDGVRDYGLTGAAIGLAVASKYTAALVVVSPLVASLLAARPVSASLIGLAVLGIAALFFCFLGTPFTFLHFWQFRQAMAFEYDHVHSLHYGFSLPAVGWQYHKYVYELCAGFPFSLGFALYGSAVAGSVWVLWNLRRENVVVLVFAASFFAILAHWTFVPLRYQLPVLVVGTALAGMWQAAWLESASRTQQALAAATVLVTGLYTAVFVVQTTARLRHDTRIEAAHWLDQTLRPGQRLLFCGYSPYLAIPSDPRIIVDAVNEAWISHLTDRHAVDLVEISSMHYWRHERHQHPAFAPEYRRFRAGEKGFRLVKRFDADFLNRELYRRLDPMFAGYFISPELEFYARDDGGA